MAVDITSKRMKFETEDGEDYANIDKIPDVCPVCEHGISPIPVTAYGIVTLYGGDRGASIQCVFRCPKKECQNLFVSYYASHYTGSSIMHDIYVFLRGTQPLPPYLEKLHFDDEIKSVSPQFIGIYTQALIAETNGLDLISGPGYRKALEFLIKDYLIGTKKAKKSLIGTMKLGEVIENYVSLPNIKEMAKRATWIGNDETHYVRKWTKMDIEDLKKLIKLTTNWISTELLTTGYLRKMPKR